MRRTVATAWWPTDVRRTPTPVSRQAAPGIVEDLSDELTEPLSRLPVDLRLSDFSDSGFDRLLHTVVDSVIKDRLRLRDSVGYGRLWHEAFTGTESVDLIARLEVVRAGSGQ